MTPPGLDGLDSLGLVGATFDMAAQIDRAIEAGTGIAGLPAHDAVEHVVLMGAGDAGVAAEMVAAVAHPFSAAPISVCEGYSPPAFVSDNTLCIVMSRAGESEETLEAAQAAAVAGCRMAIVAGGGDLLDLAQSWEAPVVPVPEDLPTERSALAALAVPAMLALEQVGLWPGATDWVHRTADQVRTRAAELSAEQNLARSLARTIGRTLPIVYGAGELGGAAARRWKAQVNKNAKVAAFSARLPELTHDEIAGWGQHGDVTRQVFTMVHLRHDQEHPQLMRRFELMLDLVDEVVHEVVEITADGDGSVAQLFDLAFIGDVVSLHLAMMEGTDPGPVPAVARVEAELVR